MKILFFNFILPMYVLSNKLLAIFFFLLYHSKYLFNSSKLYNCKNKCQRFHKIKVNFLTNLFPLNLWYIISKENFMKITKEEISQTAVQLFLDKGYNNVTIQDICNELHITKPTLYKYVNNKEELILDLYDSTIDHLVKDTYKLVDSDSHYQQLLIVFSTLIKDTKKYGYDLFSQMFIANLKENRHSFDMRDNLTKLCIIIIKKAQEQKEIHNLSNPEILYQALAHAFTGHEALWCIKKDSPCFDEAFYLSMNALLEVDSTYQDLYKEYL